MERLIERGRVPILYDSLPRDSINASTLKLFVSLLLIHVQRLVKGLVTHQLLRLTNS